MKKTKPIKAVRKRSREGTSEKLLEAGFQLFSRHGYDAVSTRDIAREAGVNVALIQRYFKGKDGFLGAVMRHFRDNRKNIQYGFYPAGQTPEEELLNYFKARLDYHIQERNFLRLVIQRSMVNPGLHNELKTKEHRATLLLGQRLLTFQSQGLIRPEMDVTEAASLAGRLSSAQDLMRHIVMNSSKERTLEDYAFFARSYALGLTQPTKTSRLTRS